MTGGPQARDAVVSRRDDRPGTGRHERGETLVETLVSLAIVALALLVVPMSVTVAGRIREGATAVEDAGTAGAGDPEELALSLVGVDGTKVSLGTRAVVREGGRYRYGRS